MPYSILGFISGLAIASSKDLEGSSAAKVAVIPGILGFNAVSLVLATVVAGQEAESLPSPVPRKATIEVTPNFRNYEASKVNETITKCFIVSNTGDAALQVTETTLSGTDASEFAIVSGGPFDVAKGNTHDVEVSFKPKSGNAGVIKQATLIITSSDKKRPIVNITLTAEIKPPVA